MFIYICSVYTCTHIATNHTCNIALLLYIHLLAHIHIHTHICQIHTHVNKYYVRVYIHEVFIYVHIQLPIVPVISPYWYTYIY